MTRKALLIGAQTDGLEGVVNDVQAMTEALESRGFQCERLVTPAATRAGILGAYEKLIADARPDDAFVVYYSGHGGLRQAPAGPDLQFIVPDDYTDSCEGDFRGITGVELSLLLNRLTDVTLNTTVILDCCHAAHMSRESGRRVKALTRPAPESWRPAYPDVRDHIAGLVAAGLPAHERAMVGNPHAVRVVACASVESAYESANGDGTRMGLFTDALARAIKESAGLRMSWSTLIDSVRRTVQQLEPSQRPEAEGPSGRLPFETADLHLLSSLPVAVTAPDTVRLLGAPLLGVEVGDEFAIMPATADGPHDGPAIGTATVERLQATAALARLRLGEAEREVPADARAHRTLAGAPALPVRLPADHPAAAELAAALALRPLLRPADRATDHAEIEVAACEGDRLVVTDRIGPLHRPYPPTPLGISAIMENLQRIAQATALRRLHGDPAKPLEHRVVAEWGRVREGREEPLQLNGALLFACPDERIYLRLRNEGDTAVFVSLIDIGISSKITVLNGADHGGVRIAPGSSYTYGWHEDQQQLVGAEVIWPDTVDTTAARPETVLLLISDGPVDVSLLRQDGVRNGVERAATGTELERLLSQIATGATRDLGGMPGAPVRYAVQPIDFTVSPAAPPAAERATFLVDDRPTRSVRLLAPRGTAPGRLAVRLADLTVHRNRALGSADIRVDAVVLTGGAGEQPIYRAETMRFSNIRDGERLPLDDVLLYHGDAVDFLDIAIWVSRDTSGSLALSSLLEQKLTSPVVQAASSQLAGLALAAPHAAVAAAVVGASAVLVNMAYELLTGVVGANVGLYRTSLLAHERFGVGRHVRHPQDFTFTFSIEPVD